MLRFSTNFFVGGRLHKDRNPSEVGVANWFKTVCLEISSYAVARAVAFVVLRVFISLYVRYVLDGTNIVNRGLNNVDFVIIAMAVLGLFLRPYQLC